MKTLFNEHNAYDVFNPEIHELITEVDGFCFSFMKKWTDAGFNPRELAHLVINTASAAESTEILTRAIEKRKEDRRA